MAAQVVWNSAIEALLRDLSSKAQLWSLLHAESARCYSKYSKIIGVPQIIINAITTSGTLATLATQNNIIAILTVLLQIIATIISAVMVFFKWEKLAHDHSKAAEIANVLAEEISIQLALDESERMDAKMFIEKARMTLETVRDKPQIMGSALEKYSKLFDSQMMIPIPPSPASVAAVAPPTAEFFGDEKLSSSSVAQALENKVTPTRLARVHEFQLQRLNTLLQLHQSQPQSTALTIKRTS